MNADIGQRTVLGSLGHAAIVQPTLDVESQLAIASAVNIDQGNLNRLFAVRLCSLLPGQ
jgi:hypothetical protein